MFSTPKKPTVAPSTNAPARAPKNTTLTFSAQANAITPGTDNTQRKLNFYYQDANHNPSTSIDAMKNSFARIKVS